uniref:Uncharacterized protein n=1 Tax=Lactuca sativa TaxID=4236 RepID=A0A9R1VRC0_LACSA|nr:hypothetical protein LSAT_V11C400189630 [Lactuca sativa]
MFLGLSVVGSLYTTQFVVPYLRNSKGKIVVISSYCGWFVIKKLGIYYVRTVGELVVRPWAFSCGSTHRCFGVLSKIHDIWKVSFSVNR